MPATNFMRLNSIGEVSTECLHEKSARKGNVDYSPSFDTISSSKCFTKGHSNHQIMSSAMFVEPEPRFAKYSQFSNPHGFTFNTNAFSQPASFRESTPYNYNYNYSRPYSQMSQISPMIKGKGNSMMNYPYSQRIPGLLPCAMFTAMPTFPSSANRMPQASQTHGPQASSLFETVMPSKSKAQKLDCMENKLKMKVNQQIYGRNVEEIDEMTSLNCKNEINSGKIDSSDYDYDVEANSQHSGQNSLMDLQIPNKANVDNENCMEGVMKNICVDIIPIVAIESNVTGNRQIQSDSVDLGIESKNLSKSSDTELAINNISKDKCLKRKNEKDEETSSSLISSCSLSNMIKDFSNVLFLRKTPKKGRPSCRKRKKRHQTLLNNSKSNDCQNGVTKNMPIPSQCETTESPAAVIPSTCSHPSFMQMSNKLNCSLPSKSKVSPSSFTQLFCSPQSDSELSDNEDDDCDSLKLSYDYPKSLSPLCNLGPALSFDSLFKPKSLPRLSTLINDSRSDQDCENESSLSSSPRKSLQVSLRLSVSDDEESDLSFDSFSSSPSEHLILDFEFGNGISLEAIFGKKSETISSPSNSKGDQCSDDEIEMSIADQDMLSILMGKNAEWNKCYPSLPRSDSSSADRRKVQFCSQDSVQIHIVENEERRGAWVQDRERFQRRIQEVGRNLSPIFTNDHRQKIRQRLGLSDS